MIAIIDYGLGNSVSVLNMIKKVGGKAEITKEESKIKSARKIILPGVGHFAKGMENLKREKLDIIIKEEVSNGKELLGICLGMQLLTLHSEEGNVEGLGLINLKTKKFDLDADKFKIPNMGWDEINIKKNHKYLAGFTDIPRFYFVHSYFVENNNPDLIIAEANYGHNYAAVIAKENICGMQFHPEKSHKYGMEVFKNFIK